MCAFAHGRGHTIYNPWHYVPVLVRKPGALRNGAPLKDWALPGALGRVQGKLAGVNDGASPPPAANLDNLRAKRAGKWSISWPPY